MSASATMFKDPFFSFNSVDLSAQIKEVAFNFDIDKLETTASGDVAHLSIAGLENPTLSITFYQQRGAGSLEATLWAQKGTAVAFELRKSTAAVGVGNAKFTGSLFWNSAPFVSGSVGQAEMAPVTFALTTAITRVIA